MEETNVNGGASEVTAIEVADRPQKVEVVVAELSAAEMAELEGFPPDRRAALRCLKMTGTMSEAAKAAGVSRSSIYRWKNENAAFRALCNRWEREKIDECSDGVTSLLSKAVAALEKALDNGDARAALVVLKSMGIMKPREMGATDLEEVEWDMALEVERKMQRMRDMEMRARVGM
jgi:DNA-binding phage protein